MEKEKRLQHAVDLFRSSYLICKHRCSVLHSALENLGVVTELDERLQPPETSPTPDLSFPTSPWGLQIKCLGVHMGLDVSRQREDIADLEHSSIFK